MPGFIKTKKDEALWKEAKSKVKKKKGMSDDEYWGAVTQVYKNMGGMKKSFLINKETGEIYLKGFASEQQKKFMFAVHPEIGKKWAHDIHSTGGPTHRMPTGKAAGIKGKKVKGKKAIEKIKREARKLRKKGKKPKRKKS
jgi:Ethanolamine utilization protein EutJ (predicted chaperonin)